MSQKQDEFVTWKLSWALLVIALFLGPVMAGPKSRDGKDGGINPTSIAVIESDLEDALVASSPDDGVALDVDGCLEEYDERDDSDATSRIGALEAHGGAAALARECRPGLSAHEVRNLLTDSVVPVRDLDEREMTGTGRIDLRLVVTN